MYLQNPGLYSPDTNHLPVLEGNLESEDEDHICFGDCSISNACHVEQAQ